MVPSRIIFAQTLGQLQIFGALTVIACKVQQNLFLVEQQSENKFLVFGNGSAFVVQENLNNVQPPCASTVLDVGHEYFSGSEQSAHDKTTTNHQWNRVPECCGGLDECGVWLVCAHGPRGAVQTAKDGA